MMETESHISLQSQLDIMAARQREAVMAEEARSEAFLATLELIRGLEGQVVPLKAFASYGVVNTNPEGKPNWVRAIIEGGSQVPADEYLIVGESPWSRSSIYLACLGEKSNFMYEVSVDCLRAASAEEIAATQAEREQQATA